jgi:hypothetical protein
MVVLLCRLEAFSVSKVLLAQLLGVYKFITLFSSINKIIEKTVGERIAVIIKKYNLFP